MLKVMASASAMSGNAGLSVMQVRLVSEDAIRLLRAQQIVKVRKG